MAAQPEATMTAQLIDGKAIAKEVRDEVAEKVQKRLAAGKSRPTLATVLVGDRVDSQTYVRSKRKACEELGMGSIAHQLSAEISQEDLVRLKKIYGLDRSMNFLIFNTQGKKLSSFAPGLVDTATSYNYQKQLLVHPDEAQVLALTRSHVFKVNLPAKPGPTPWPKVKTVNDKEMNI